MLETKHDPQTGCEKQRRELILKLKLLKQTPQIVLLKTVSSEDADHYEKYYYEDFKKQGITLLQTDFQFSWTKRYLNKNLKQKKPYSIRIEPALLKQLQKVAKEENRSLANLIETAILESLKTREKR